MIMQSQLVHAKDAPARNGVVNVQPCAEINGCDSGRKHWRWEGRQMTTFKLSLETRASCDVAADLRQLSPTADPIGWGNGP
jgi:hypothetical protein